ncbi:hypothetical protein VIGAN_03176300 [Vigna angularis var. angularis]|uniref:Uncharacterized protein n=1 Tax=Vigna angularis var. angularis TaxID=157739 RepID=A0A0S3RMP4_PHAAN|nr:hypothetical protein VIGAN_03176300 [Vigna angularis var. angularis]
MNTNIHNKGPMLSLDGPPSRMLEEKLAMITQQQQQQQQNQEQQQEQQQQSQQEDTPTDDPTTPHVSTKGSCSTADQKETKRIHPNCKPYARIGNSKSQTKPSPQNAKAKSRRHCAFVEPERVTPSFKPLPRPKQRGKNLSPSRRESKQEQREKSPSSETNRRCRSPPLTIITVAVGRGIFSGRDAR